MPFRCDARATCALHSGSKPLPFRVTAPRTNSPARLTTGAPCPRSAVGPSRGMRDVRPVRQHEAPLFQDLIAFAGIADPVRFGLGKCCRPRSERRKSGTPVSCWIYSSDTARASTDFRLTFARHTPRINPGRDLPCHALWPQ
jgi:hypothetical protein